MFLFITIKVLFWNRQGKNFTTTVGISSYCGLKNVSKVDRDKTEKQIDVSSTNRVSFVSIV